MARKVRHSALESRSARLKLSIRRRRPYAGPSLARGLALMYRRNKTSGTWVLKASAYWTKAIGLADDFEDANGKAVPTFCCADVSGITVANDLPIRAACIDSGGHHTVNVYNFVRDKQARSIWATKGASRPGMSPWPRRVVRAGKTTSTPLYIIGVDQLKDGFAARLRIEQPGLGFCHFPVERGPGLVRGLNKRATDPPLSQGRRAP